MRIEAAFVTSATAASGFPDDLPAVAMVGRSNVGKSSLINALVRQRLARTSAAPGKTRLANIYRVARVPGHARGGLNSSKGGGAAALYLVDLPGYGYTRAPRQAGGGPRGAEGRAQAAREFAELTAAYFGHDDRPARQAARSALLLVDSRHPGLESDLEAWTWLGTVVADRAIAATKVDKLARGERTRAMRTLESVFEHPVLPVSAATGEGLDELWRMIDRLANNPVETASRPRPPKN